MSSLRARFAALGPGDAAASAKLVRRARMVVGFILDGSDLLMVE